jgi:hypothetical protein
MSTTHSEIISNDRINLLDELQVLLERQIELARQGRLGEFEALSRQADALVGKIIQTGTLDPSEAFCDVGRRKQLKRLYEDLCLTITAQKAGVCENISQVRKGKRTIQAYRGHV